MTSVVRHGKGPARGYSWETFKDGNVAAVKSGYWITPTLLNTPPRSRRSRSRSAT